MARIHKRTLRSGDVVWELTHGTGRDRQRMVAGKTREEAQEVLKQFERQLALHGHAPSDDSIESAVGQYTAYLRVNRRAATVKRYLRVVRTFTECFIARDYPDLHRLRQVRPIHVEAYKQARFEGRIAEERSAEAERRAHELRTQMRGRRPEGTPRERGKFGWLGSRPVQAKVSLRTINYELRALFTFFHWATKRNLLFVNPAVDVERFRLPKRALPKFMTSNELTKFFHACSEDDRRLFMTILLTGMRKGEVEHLCWSDINFELGVVFIQEKPDLSWKPKTDERVIPISPVLRELLLQQYGRRRSDRFVFANRTGQIDTHTLERLKKACVRAGIRPSTVHALRHSFGAHLRMAGVNLADIGDLLGHKDLATTQIYAKVQQDHLRQAISKLAPLIDVPERSTSSPRHIVAPGTITEPTKSK